MIDLLLHLAGDALRFAQHESDIVAFVLRIDAIPGVHVRQPQHRRHQ